MNKLEEFHHRQKSRNRNAKLTIAAIILVVLAGLGVYGHRLDELAQPHYAVPNGNLPAP